MKHTVLHGVDATELVKSLHAQPSAKDTGKVTFDKIIFNFPLAPLTKTLADVKVLLPPTSSHQTGIYCGVLSAKLAVSFRTHQLVE